MRKCLSLASLFNLAEYFVERSVTTLVGLTVSHSKVMLRVFTSEIKLDLLGTNLAKHSEHQRRRKKF
jgi:hypothetical protein